MLPVTCVIVCMQEKGKWTGVSACVPGDFSLRGHSQILLLGDKDQGVLYSYSHWKLHSSNFVIFQVTLFT